MERKWVVKFGLMEASLMSARKRINCLIGEPTITTKVAHSSVVVVVDET